jgi:vacuolar iron transporter family protein
MRPIHREAHLIERVGWLRAAVLGANDGIISTASLVVGVAAAATSPQDVLVAGTDRPGRWRNVHGGGRVRLG